MSPTLASDLAALFEDTAAGTIGVEEEIMLLDPATLDLVPRAPELLARLDGDPRFKLELPASQIEIALGPFEDVHALAGALPVARAELARAATGLVTPAAAGVHPFSAGIGELNEAERYRRYAAEYGGVVRRQLVCALQVHVAVGGAERTLAVYNALRDHLPLLAALAANAPFYEGRDCGLASVRPKLGELLPRQGVPPALESWGHYAEALRWGRRAGAFPGPEAWWWELRPHPRFGTLELRVPDAQSSPADALGVALVAAALARRLSERFDDGERWRPAETWRIEQNRWSACRHGVEGTMADLRTGEVRSTRECLLELLEALAPVARTTGPEAVYEHARRLVDAGGAARLRADATRLGMHGAVAALAARFLEAAPG